VRGARFFLALAIGAMIDIGGGEARACTTFCLRDAGRVVFGRNYDFMIGDGLVVVNKRGVEKTSDVDGSRPAIWTSTYGSVTFNQFGRDFPTGGVNEMGLVVELMWLEGTRYPAADARPAVGVLEWIQYQLDRRRSVAELLAHKDEVRIEGATPLHYLVADRTGEVATIEFLDGRLVAHSGAGLTVPVLTNDEYERSLAYTSRHPAATGGSSLDRFARAAAMVARRDPGDSSSLVDYAFGILRSVSQGQHTRWSIVYDLTGMVVSFRTSSHPAIRSFTVSEFDFACATPVRMLDVNAPLAGDVTGRFTDYTSGANHDLVSRSYARVPFLSGVPPERVERVARHPDGTRCLPQPRER